MPYPAPPLRVRPGSRRLVWSLYALALIVAPLVFDSSLGQSLLSQIGIAIIVCLSYNMLLGQGGMLSFGHAVYSGMGAFLTMHALNRVAGGLALPVSLLPLAGGLGSLVLALPLGWVSTRKGATPFAMITLALGELVWAAALMWPGFFGGEGGVSGNRVVGASFWGLSYGPQIQLYYLVAAYTFVCTALMFAFTRTPLGCLLNAVRDNPERVEFVGYDSQVVRFLAFVIAAFFAGIGGGLAALHFEIVTSDVFSAWRSGAYLLFTFLGGTPFFFGPIIGAVLMVLAYALLSQLSRAWMLYLGLLFVAMVMLAPGGVAGLLVQQWRLLKAGHLRRLGLAYLMLAATAALAFCGLAAMVEMAYRLQLDAALGPILPFLGGTLDASAPGNWFGAGFVLLTGLALLELVRRQFMRRWQALENDDSAVGQRGAP